MSGPPNGLCLGIVVWGRAFVDTLTDLMLPSLLAPGNLPAFAWRERTILLLITTREDEARIRAAPVFAALSAQVTVEFMIFADRPMVLDPPQLKYHLMTMLHEHLVARARRDDLGVIMLTPDVILADGALCRIERTIASGKRVLIAHAPSLERSLFMPLLIEWLRDTGGALDGRALAVPPRALMRMATRSYHRVTWQYMADSDQFNPMTSATYWRLGDEGLLARVFHSGPVYFHPADWSVPVVDDPTSGKTIDISYIGRACPDPESYDLIGDSDEFLYVEISDADKVYPVPDRNRASPTSFALFAATNGGPMNLRFFAHKLWLHTGIDRAAHAEVERRSDAFVDEVLAMMPSVERALARRAEANA
jgi:hypothetical protein